jgi:hypothetical protein
MHAVSLLVLFGSVICRRTAADKCFDLRPKPLRIHFIPTESLSGPDQFETTVIRVSKAIGLEMRKYLSTVCSPQYHEGYSAVGQFPVISGNTIEADLLIFLTTGFGEDCKQHDALGFAIVLEQKLFPHSPQGVLGRSTVGHINFCSRSLVNIAGLVEHEVMHTLGAVETINRSKGSQNFIVNSREFKLLKTPALVRQTRNFFDCKFILGMAKTNNSHFIPEYAMALDQDNSLILSPVVLGYFEDIGYIVNYTGVPNQKAIHRGCSNVPAILRYPVIDVEWRLKRANKNFTLSFTLDDGIPCLTIAQKESGVEKSGCLPYRLTASNRLALNESEANKLSFWLLDAGVTRPPVILVVPDSVPPVKIFN